MKFSIIICGYNEAANLDACITSCLNQDYPKDQFEVVYVDNNSSDGSLELVQKYPIKAVLETKQGPSEARNRGMKESKGEMYLFIDSDALLNPDYLKNCEEALKPENIGASAGKVLPRKSTIVSNYLGASLFEGYPRYSRRKFVFSAPSCNLAVKRSVIEKVGDFMENLSSGSGITRFSEDKELCGRIRHAGYKIVYDPAMSVRHDNADTFSRLWKVWNKGSLGRVGMIRMGKYDFYSILFRYNIFIVYVLLLLTALFFSLKSFCVLVAIGFFIQLALCIKSFIETGLFFSSFIVKPILDPLSALIINLAVLKNRILIK